MENSDSKSTYWNKFFAGFAIVTILSGIYLIIQKDYLIGISGSITGFFLLYMQNVKPTKEKNNE